MNLKAQKKRKIISFIKRHIKKIFKKIQILTKLFYMIPILGQKFLTILDVTLLNMDQCKIWGQIFFQGIRHFNAKWYPKSLSNGDQVDRQWMLYSKSKDSPFCFPCLLFLTDKKSKFANLTVGFSNWIHLHLRIPEHENSVENRKCYSF